MQAYYEQSDLYMREILPVPLLSEDDERKLFKLIYKGDDQAREKVLKANLKLVVKITKKYAGLGVSFMDLVAEGNLGLIRASHRFDLTKNCRFSTYASCWIKQYIMRALSNQRKTIRVPVYMVERIGHINKTINRIKGEYDRNPSVEEIAEQVDLSAKKVLEVFNIAKNTYSIHAMLGDGIDFEEVIEDKRAVNAEKMISHAFLHNELVDLMGYLKPREVDILSKRYGFDGGRKMTLKDIGAHYSISRERVRQIEQSALRKLKSMLRQKHIRFDDLV
jgi:RNA polymerase primary sigma factor